VPKFPDEVVCVRLFVSGRFRNKFISDLSDFATAQLDYCGRFYLGIDQTRYERQVKEIGQDDVYHFGLRRTLIFSIQIPFLVH